MAGAPEDERPPAPAWWWGPAMEVRDVDLKFRPHGSVRLGLPDGATYADGAHVLFGRWPGRPTSPGPMIFRAR